MPDANKKSRASTRTKSVPRTPGHGLSGSAVESDKEAAKRYQRERSEALQAKRDHREEEAKSLRATLESPSKQTKSRPSGLQKPRSSRNRQPGRMIRWSKHSRSRSRRQSMQG